MQSWSRLWFGLGQSYKRRHRTPYIPSSGPLLLEGRAPCCFLPQSTQVSHQSPWQLHCAYGCNTLALTQIKTPTQEPCLLQQWGKEIPDFFECRYGRVLGISDLEKGSFPTMAVRTTFPRALGCWDDFRAAFGAGRQNDKRSLCLLVLKQWDKGGWDRSSEFRNSSIPYPIDESDTPSDCHKNWPFFVVFWK